MAGERTEKPTPKRLEDARKKGQVARTKEAAQAASLLGPMLVLAWAGEWVIRRLGQAVADGLRRAGDAATTPLVEGDMTRLVWGEMAIAGTIVAPVAFGSAVLVAVSFVAQGKPTFAPKALQAKWDRLSPANGLKRFGLSQGGLELLRMSLAVTLIGLLAWHLVQTYLASSPQLARLTPIQSAHHMWGTVSGLLRSAGLGLLLLAVADFLVQRRKHLGSLKMTKQEIRDESRLMEGSPEIKMRVRRIQREMSRRRMLNATKTATVVIVNPTHYAVALEYRREGLAAPRVVAKGKDLLALRIRDVARAHGVPVVENVQLARALHDSAEIGDFIPPALFDAVAEVLAYLVRVKQLVL